MPTDDNKRSIHQELVTRILKGPGRASTDQRARAFENAGLPEPLRVLLDKVATRSAQVTDADFATAREAGFTDEQLFELVICAAVGESTRQYEAGLAALSTAPRCGRDHLLPIRLLRHLHEEAHPRGHARSLGVVGR